jgi:hypothetical protein
MRQNGLQAKTLVRKWNIAGKNVGNTEGQFVGIFAGLIAGLVGKTTSGCYAGVRWNRG